VLGNPINSASDISIGSGGSWRRSSHPSFSISDQSLWFAEPSVVTITEPDFVTQASKTERSAGLMARSFCKNIDIVSAVGALSDIKAAPRVNTLFSYHHFELPNEALLPAGLHRRCALHDDDLQKSAPTTGDRVLRCDIVEL